LGIVEGCKHRLSDRAGNHGATAGMQDDVARDVECSRPRHDPNAVGDELPPVCHDATVTDAEFSARARYPDVSLNVPAGLETGLVPKEQLIVLGVARLRGRRANVHSRSSEQAQEHESWARRHVSELSVWQGTRAALRARDGRQYSTCNTGVKSVFIFSGLQKTSRSCHHVIGSAQLGTASDIGALSPPSALTVWPPPSEQPAAPFAERNWPSALCITCLKALNAMMGNVPTGWHAIVTAPEAQNVTV